MMNDEISDEVRMTLPDRLREHLASLDDDPVAPVAAAKFVSMMKEHHPHEFVEWLLVEAERFVTAEVRRELRRQERRNRRAAQMHEQRLRGPFAKFADEFAEQTRRVPLPNAAGGLSPAMESALAQAKERKQRRDRGLRAVP